MTAVAAIVEGDGEVAAVPILLRRLAQWLTPGVQFSVLPPIRVRRDRFLNREHEFRRMLLLAAAKCGDDGWVLVLLDADDDCPADAAPAILARALDVIPHRRISIVLANREYESWLVAAARSLEGRRGFRRVSAMADDCESVRNAKGWIAECMEDHAYRETTDQPAFTAVMDLTATHQASRSFRKLCSEWRRQTGMRAE